MLQTIVMAYGKDLKAPERESISNLKTQSTGYFPVLTLARVGMKTY